MIDGQQRLTTLSIFLLALYKELKKYTRNYSVDAHEEEISKIITFKKYFKSNKEIRLCLSRQNYNNKDYKYLVDNVLENNTDSPKYYGNRRISKAFN